MAVFTGSRTDFFIGRCPCGVVHSGTPHFRTNSKFRPVELYTKSSSSSASTEISRKSSYLSLRLPRSSLTEDPQFNSEDEKSLDAKFGAFSHASSSESDRGGPYVPGKTQKSVSNKKSNAAVQSALERAAAYKKLKTSGSGASSLPQSAGEKSALPLIAPKNLPEIEIVRGQNVQSKLQPSDSLTLLSSDSAVSEGSAAKSTSNVTSSNSLNEKTNDVQKFMEEKLAANASAKETKSIASIERARGYKQQQTEMVAALQGSSAKSSSDTTGTGKEKNPGSSTSVGDVDIGNVVEIEIITRDGVIKRKMLNPNEQVRAFSNIKDVKRKGVSGIDFAGLGFADKKKSGRPGGLTDDFVAPPTGALPEVEILTRDAAGSSQTENAEQNQGSELYKPRVSTWGVFPRPADISKAYGGGRTIRPGESLETEEERKVRETRTQKLLADYRKKMGLDVDPKVKAETEELLKKADCLMDSGRLKDALMLYELAMTKMPPQSELHGVAALQAAVSLDSLSRYDEARQVYEKLLGHPNGRISKQARRFLFGFKAMEKLKVSGGYEWDTSAYQKYFDSFSGGYKNAYKADADENISENLVPYALLLLLPIVLVFALAASKG